MNYPFDLQRREAAAITQRRARALLPPTAGTPVPDPARLPPDTMALALSGGGIRCAVFSLGVLQALAKKGRLRQIDILSALSGGGYAGAFLGRLFTRKSVAEQADPCARVEQILAQDGSPELDWLRAHANYILSQGESDLRQHLATIWRNLLAIYFILFCFATALMGLLCWSSGWLPAALAAPKGLPLPQQLFPQLSPWWWLPPALFALTVLPAALAYWLAPKAGTRGTFSFLPWPAGWCCSAPRWREWSFSR